MMAKGNSEWYEPLRLSFRGKEGFMSREKFAAVEAVLYMLLCDDSQADPESAYLLFTKYQIIGAADCRPDSSRLQRASYQLYRYRSKKRWQEDLRKYREDRYIPFRAFEFAKGEKHLTVSKTEGYIPHPFQDRQKEWERLWQGAARVLRSVQYAENGKYQYTRPAKQVDGSGVVTVQLPEKCCPPETRIVSGKGKRPAITVSVDELLATAEEMERLQPGDPCYKVQRTNSLKKCSGSSVEESRQLAIDGVVNIVGMVGAGKSTLIKVLSVWCAKQGIRIVIAVDTVAEALNLYGYLHTFGISCSPLVGRSDRLKYINQVSKPGETCLAPHISRYLTNCCLIDGMDEKHDTAMAFGKEPCFQLQQEGSKDRYLCPWFHLCPGTAMMRECYESSVVITTAAGLAASRVGEEQELFLELVLHEFDAVIFDECDRAQNTLDQFFCPEVSFDEYIQESVPDCMNHLRKPVQERERDVAQETYIELQLRAPGYMRMVLTAVRENQKTWKRISSGSPFSALMLLEDMAKDGDNPIPEAVQNGLHRLIDDYDAMQEKDSALWAVAESLHGGSNDGLFELQYAQWIRSKRADSEPGPAGNGEKTEVETDKPRSQELLELQDARIKLVLKLIFFEHFIQMLSETYETSHETPDGQNKLFSFLRNRFRQQQLYLPSALCGNLFGMKMADNGDLVLFRQYAFGRSLMKDLPYLRTEEDGSPAGPHTILLSGSSWAPGSYEYHVNRPVNYILEAEKRKREYLKGISFQKHKTNCRVSGSEDSLRIKRLCELAKESIEKIIQEYERDAGKLLLVVNSYKQAEVLQKHLERYLAAANCNAKVCRMVQDARSEEYAPGGGEIPVLEESGTIRRGEVSRFAEMPHHILIAPAMAIERGHNIVDESGHSALAAVFFMVRPMQVPDDMQLRAAKLNGMIEAASSRDAKETIHAFNARVRKAATAAWGKMNQPTYGMDSLKENEKRDVVATLFVLILQIFGRLARVTDLERKEKPHVWFMDGAFQARQGRRNSFDCLVELGKYLEDMMNRGETQKIAQTLYEPFYEAYRRDILDEH